jgi:P-type Ca2+ transporter type 2C
MITGDHVLTAARIAAQLGISSSAGEVVAITGVELETLDEATLRERARAATVFARVAPEHKLRIVDALQANGEVVAMTGDGVNDAPALKSADIGIAMGITGTDVTKEAARMILADDNFATIVAAVREGRGIFSNIRRFLRYLLSSNAGEVLTVFLGVLGASWLGLDVVGEEVVAPLLATQILWINLLTDSAPALALGFDPPPEDVMRRRPRRPTDRVIDRRMQVGVVFIGLVMAVATLLTIDMMLPGGLIQGSGDLDRARTMGFTVLVLAQLFNAFNSRSDHESAFRGLFTNYRLFGAVGLSLVLQVLVVHLPFLNEAFSTVPLSLAEWLTCLAIASLVLWAEELKKLVIRLRTPTPG